MTARIWRAGDEPLPPGTRVRALVVPSVPNAEGDSGRVSVSIPDGAWVNFGRKITNQFGARSAEWLVTECEVIDDGGEQ